MSDSPRILLVDDEADLSRLLAQYLERAGYRVDICGSAEEALASFDETPDAWDLVLTDLSLPGAHGDEMLRRMLNSRPGLRAILSSGYAYRVESIPVATPKQIAFLQKPYLPAMLTETLRKMLKQPKAG